MMTAVNLRVVAVCVGTESGPAPWPHISRSGTLQNLLLHSQILTVIAMTGNSDVVGAHNQVSSQRSFFCTSAALRRG